MRKHDIFTHENNMLFSHVKVSPLLCSLVKYSSTREEKLRISKRPCNILYVSIYVNELFQSALYSCTL